jgi:ParB/RepB/Spo0J family partition protein
MQIGKMPTLKWLKVDDIRVPEGRLNSYFEDSEDFEASVKAEGVIQPIYVFKDENGVHWLADGKNRLETAKKHGKTMIPTYILDGSMEDALLYSAKLNVHRGKVNVGELAEFVKRLKGKGMKAEDIADSLKLSKGYVSKLLTVADNGEILEKLKKGSVSLMEAYESCKSFLMKPESQETIQEKPSEITTVERKPLTDEALGLTSSFKEAVEKREQFKHEEAEGTKKMETGFFKRDLRGQVCAYCGVPFSKEDSEFDNVRWIPVHKHEKSKAYDVLEKARAESKAQNESCQPRGEEHGEERGSS